MLIYDLSCCFLRKKSNRHKNTENKTLGQVSEHLKKQIQCLYAQGHKPATITESHQRLQTLLQIL